MFAALGFLKSAQLDVGTRPELQEQLTLWGDIPPVWGLHTAEDYF